MTPTYVSRSRPRPPYSSGMVMPKRPRSRILATISSGNVSVCSRSDATGMTSRCTNLRTVSMISARTDSSTASGTAPVMPATPVPSSSWR